jgi:hypothetical protein
MVTTKILVETLARELRSKLIWFSDVAVNHTFLFSDMQVLQQKPIDDFQTAVSYRIKGYDDEQEKIRLATEQAELDRATAEKKELEQAVTETEQVALQPAVAATADHCENVLAMVDEIAESGHCGDNTEKVGTEETIATVTAQPSIEPTATEIPDEKITISLKDYNDMLNRLLWLECLTQVGVNNWVLIDQARQIYADAIKNKA